MKTREMIECQYRQHCVINAMMALDGVADWWDSICSAAYPTAGRSYLGCICGWHSINPARPSVPFFSSALEEEEGLLLLRSIFNWRSIVKARPPRGAHTHRRRRRITSNVDGNDFWCGRGRKRHDPRAEDDGLSFGPKWQSILLRYFGDCPPNAVSSFYSTWQFVQFERRWRRLQKVMTPVLHLLLCRRRPEFLRNIGFTPRPVGWSIERRRRRLPIEKKRNKTGVSFPSEYSAISFTPHGRARHPNLIKMASSSFAAFCSYGISYFFFFFVVRSITSYRPAATTPDLSFDQFHTRPFLFFFVLR